MLALDRAAKTGDWLSCRRDRKISLGQLDTKNVKNDANDQGNAKYGE